MDLLNESQSTNEDSDARMVHMSNLREVHKSLKEVTYGYSFDDHHEPYIFEYTKNGRSMFINGIIKGYQKIPTHTDAFFMHNYKFKSRTKSLGGKLSFI